MHLNIGGNSETRLSRCLRICKASVVTCSQPTMYGRGDCESFWPDVAAPPCVNLAIVPESDDDAPMIDIPAGLTMKRPSGAVVMKRPSGAVVMKRPSGAKLEVVNRLTNPVVVKKPSGSTSSANPSPTTPTLKGRLLKVYYSRTGAIGIRVRGGRQLMQVQSTIKDDDLIESWADECIRQLENGETVEHVKQWVQTQKTDMKRKDPFLEAAIATYLD